MYTKKPFGTIVPNGYIVLPVKSLQLIDLFYGKTGTFEDIRNR
ncbi:hypothetical protein [Sphingobacterium faecale]|nr:hypothetical protein [Sphingobacterium faecale]